MDELSMSGRPRFHLECTFDERHGILQSRFVIPVDLAQHVASLYSVSCLPLQIQPDGWMDDVINAVSSGSEFVGSQSQKPGIASCHKAVGS